MTNREELIETVLDRICMAPTQKAAVRPIVANGLDAALAHLAMKGWKITGPKVSEYQRETVREHGGNQAVAYLNAAWPEAHAAAPDLLSEDANGK